VSPILGIWASQNYPRITNSYESIATVTVGAGGQSSISFSSIPSTYKHLQFRISSKAANNGNTFFRFNGDSSTSYSWHSLYGSGSSAAGYGGSTTNQAYTGEVYTNANIFTGEIVDILDYANTFKYKTMRTLTGVDLNGSGSIQLDSGLWQSTAAISSVVIYPPSSGSFTQYSSFALYGIRG
jgi:hypothetical protein